MCKDAQLQTQQGSFMETMQLLGDTGSGVGSTALAAGAGAFIGSWFGDAWGGNRGFGGGYGVPIAPVAPAAAAIGLESMLMDSIGSNGAKLDSLTIATLQGQAANALTSCEGFNGVNQTVLSSMAAHQNAVNQGFAGINNAVTSGNFGVQNTLTQGFAGLNNSVVSQGYESRLASGQISREIASCCCATQKAIAEEGAATRALIQSNFITDLQTKLCDEKANNAALRSEVALNASQARQTDIILTHLQALDR